MNKIELPAGLTGIILLTPAQLNKCRYVQLHTVLTPERLRKSKNNP